MKAILSGSGRTKLEAGGQNLRFSGGFAWSLPAWLGMAPTTKMVMKAKLILLTLALGASTGLLSAQDNNPPPDGQRPPMREGGPGGPGMRGPGRPGFHLLPPPVQERLNLSDDQKKQLAELEAEVKAKMEKILTPEQLQQLKQMRPPQGQGGPQDQGGPGGQGGARRGRGPGGQGGPQGEGRPPGPPQDQ